MSLPTLTSRIVIVLISIACCIPKIDGFVSSSLSSKSPSPVGTTTTGSQGEWSITNKLLFPNPQQTLVRILGPEKHDDQRRAKTKLYMRNNYVPGKLWNRLGIEEDTEPKWYLLNCQAGLEIELLEQCQIRCDGMDDVEKFVVPTETKTRSHGAKKMVREEKVKYPGCVFAKIRLTQDTYETIQSIDYCRTFMGASRRQGLQKLPTIPAALLPNDVEQFGLDDLEPMKFDSGYGEEAGEGSVGVILDSESDEDYMLNQDEQIIKNEYGGFRVEDMVRVIGKNKYINEDGIVQRLKDGKLMVRFYTYGSTNDAWMDPSDVRKLSNVEILKGLSGPTQPITQRDFDNSRRNNNNNSYGTNRFDNSRRNDYGPRRDNDNFGPSRRNQATRFGGPRNRRQDRAGQGRYVRDSDRDGGEADKNWKWFKEEQQQQQRLGRRNNYQDSYFDSEVRVGSRRDNSRRDNGRKYNDRSFAQGDVDSQWGRPSQRQDYRQRQPNTRGPPNRRFRDGGIGDSNNSRRMRDAVDGEDDWSAFVSPAKSPKGRGSNNDDHDQDDFFSSLMSDLSQNLDSPGTSTNRRTTTRRNTNDNGRNDNDDDDFFASLMSEMEGAPSSGPSRSNSGYGNDTPDNSRKRQSLPSKQQVDDVDDFFSSLEAELGDDGSLSSQASPSSSSTNRNTNDADDDFFASLSADLDAQNSPPKPRKTRPSTEDDFFAALEVELKDDSSINVGNSGDGGSHEVIPADDDFFSSLEADLNGGESSTTAVKNEPSQKSTTKDNNDDAFTFDGGDVDDFFENLGKDMDAADMGSSTATVEQVVEEPTPPKPKKRSKSAPPPAAKSLSSPSPPPPSQPVSPPSSSPQDLSKCTVPVLKDMLRERGLKVSGKKAELIERLTENA